MNYSPLLAIVTGVLEFATALWVFARPNLGRRRITLPVGLIFLFLAGYQFAEVAVCARPQVKLLSQLAYFDITWLPPIGLWLLSELARPRMRWFRVVALADIALASALSVWILTSPAIITKSVCQTVIARYYLTNPFDTLYGVFYQSGLVFLIFGSILGMVSTDDRILRKHWANFQAGVLAFVLPALYIRVMIGSELNLLPSVMCHFATFMAVSLFFLVLRERKVNPA